MTNRELTFLVPSGRHEEMVTMLSSLTPAERALSIMMGVEALIAIKQRYTLAENKEFYVRIAKLEQELKAYRYAGYIPNTVSSTCSDGSPTTDTLRPPNRRPNGSPTTDTLRPPNRRPNGTK